AVRDAALQPRFAELRGFLVRPARATAVIELGQDLLGQVVISQERAARLDQRISHGAALADRGQADDDIQLLSLAHAAEWRMRAAGAGLVELVDLFLAQRLA